MAKLPFLIFFSLAAPVILSRISLDFYLPALPHMEKVFNASEAELQATLTSFACGYALSLLISGPLSDMYGRKKVLLTGLLIYILATLACIFAITVESLIIARFFQALGGCCGTVISRALISDTYKEQRQIRLLSDISASVAICSYIAPLIAGGLFWWLGWQSLFYCLSVLSTCIFILVLRHISETSPVSTDSPLKKIFITYKTILLHRKFILYSLGAGFAWGGYFTFALCASFLLKDLGFNALTFSLTYSLVIAGFLIGTRLTKYIASKRSCHNLLYIANLFYFLGAISLLIFSMWKPFLWQTLIFPMFFVTIGVGIIIPLIQVIVIKPFKATAGTAIGLFFFIQISIGCVEGIMVSFFQQNLLMAMSVAIVISAALLLIVFLRIPTHPKK